MEEVRPHALMFEMLPRQPTAQKSVTKVGSTGFARSFHLSLPHPSLWPQKGKVVPRNRTGSRAGTGLGLGN